MPPDEDEILLFKQREQEILRCKTSWSHVRTNLNTRSDLVEFVINNRTKRLERYIEKSNTKKWIKSKSNRNMLALSPSNNTKFNTFRNSVFKYEMQSPIKIKSKVKFVSPSRTLLKSRNKNQPIDAGRVSKILKTIKKKQKKQIVQNILTENITKPIENPFECIDIIDNLKLIYEALSPSDDLN